MLFKITCLIILLMLVTYLLTAYGDCLEKFDVGHYILGLEGLKKICTFNLENSFH